MSDTYGTTPLEGTGGSLGTESPTAQTVKDEASAVAGTAGEAAKDVAHTTKDEAKSVAREAKNQLGSLYAQSRQELGDQASKQQQRLADGLRSVGDELGSMARGSETGGVASDLVQRASDRVGSAAGWLSDRDPASVLSEVKSFARRRPGVFIAGALIAGVVVGRLTRALASNASDSSGASGSSGFPGGNGGGATYDAAGRVPSVSGAGGAVTPGTTAGSADPVYGAGAAVGASDAATDPAVGFAGDADDSPLYAQESARWNERQGAADDRSDTF